MSALEAEGVRCYGHSEAPPTRSVIVYRDPLDRFASAFRHAVKYFGANTRLKAIVRAGITTPNDFAEALLYRDPLALSEYRNDIHTIGSFKPEMRWPWCPQYYWWNVPRHVVRFENINTEIPRLFGDHIVLPHLNATEGSYRYSSKAVEFLTTLYEKDIVNGLTWF